MSTLLTIPKVFKQEPSPAGDCIQMEVHSRAELIAAIAGIDEEQPDTVIIWQRSDGQTTFKFPLNARAGHRGAYWEKRQRKIIARVRQLDKECSR